MAANFASLGIVDDPDPGTVLDPSELRHDPGARHGEAMKSRWNLLPLLFVCACLGTSDLVVQPAPDHPASPQGKESAWALPAGTLAMGEEEAIAGKPVGEHAHAEGEAARPASYSCPMHPDVVSDQPGNCPRCGMRLRETKQEAPK